MKKGMRRGKPLFYSLTMLLLLLCLLPACSRTGTTVTNNEAGNNGPASTANSSQPGLNAAGGTNAVGGVVSFFRGVIGEKNRVQMRLVRNGDDFNGAYSYVKVGTELSLKGSLDRAGNLTLQEFDASGTQTGLFKGKWTEDADAVGVRVVGDWSRPNGDKKSPFVLTQQQIKFTGDTRFADKLISEHNAKLKYAIEAAYPQLAGSASPNVEKFNREAASLVTKTVAEWKKGAASEPAEDDGGGDEMVINENTLDVDYEVVLANNDLISLIFTVSDFPRGAAHGSYHGEAFNYDLKTGRLLKLSDLFQPRANYLKTISDYCIKDLKAQNAKQKPDERMLDDESIEGGAGPEENNYSLWNITEKGLLITFDVYQVGPFAAGRQEVLVPYANLKGMLRPDGPTAPFVK